MHQTKRDRQFDSFTCVCLVRVSQPDLLLAHSTELSMQKKKMKNNKDEQKRRKNNKNCHLNR